MSAEKTEAIVIRLADFSNTSRVVTFFTREFGRVAALAKGGKRLKGPFDTGIDLLSTCRIVFLRKSSSALDILTEAALVERFRPQAGTLNGFYAGCYVAELLSGLTADHDPHPVLYDVARGTLTAFQTATDIRLVVVWFELSLLKETGHLPDFNDCLHCGAPIEVSRSSSFRALPGGLLCPQCPPQEFIRQHIHAGTVALSRALTNSSTVMPPHLTASDQQIRELRFLLTTSISGLLGRRPGTLKFIEF